MAKVAPLLLAALVAVGGSLTLVAADPDTKQEMRALEKQALEMFSDGKLDSAALKLQTMREEDPENPDGYYQGARVALAQGDSVSARELTEQGVANARPSSRLLLLTAALRLASGQFDGADGLVDQVLRRKLRNGEALYLKGLIHLERGDSTLALDCWESALSDRSSR